MNKITLEEVAKQFDSWRTSRSGGPQRTPDHLKELVLQLIPNYPKRQIIKTLKIGRQLFNSFHQSCKTQQQNDDLHFTPIKLLDIDTSITQHDCQIQISKNGATLLITTTTPEIIVKQFLCYS